MNVVRNAVGSALRCRTYATYVPPASLREFVPYPSRQPMKPPPKSPNFYTGRSQYYDQLGDLETAVQQTRQALQSLQLLPLPVFARNKIPPVQHVWQSKRDVTEWIGTTISMTRYRRLVSTLNQLDQYRRIADVAGVEVLADRIQDILSVFEKPNKAAILAQGKRKPVDFDEYGRTYTTGRRKTSSARAWTIAVQKPPEVIAPEPETVAEPLPQIESTVTSALGDDPLEPVQVTTGNIIVNNRPLVDYFPQLPDRERVILPFKVAGLIGAYNVFAIVRGGGSTGQSGALSLAIAKAIAAHAPDVEPLLRKAKLMRRDPRMVERKKTGRKKARADYNWVKR